MKIGIIREEKVPHDKRVPFTPVQCKYLLEQHPDLELKVQPCAFRCYSDDEYRAHGIQLSDDLSGCDILMGIKEVPKEFLIENKKYLFFSHTIKKQPQNKNLLQSVSKKNIQLIDYECLTDIDSKTLATPLHLSAADSNTDKTSLYLIMFLASVSFSKRSATALS